MKSSTLLAEPISEIVNVSSVPQRSPFRYPGGKTWLIPQIRKWLSSLPSKPSEFVEPFGGGAIVSLTVAAENLANHVTLVELDDDVASVWQTIITDGEGEWLARKIRNFDLTEESVHDVLSKSPKSMRERAFQTIVKNRVYHGGILAPGSGLIKHGENGKGLKSRWYPGTLSDRILAIDNLRHKMTFVHGDGLKVLQQHSKRKSAVFFIDPPYTAGGKNAGKRLYQHWQIDHEELFRITHSVNGDFLMTYDNAEELRQLASANNFEVHLVGMNNTHHAKMTELLIGKNLEWAKCANEVNSSIFHNVWE